MLEFFDFCFFLQAFFVKEEHKIEQTAAGRNLPAAFVCIFRFSGISVKNNHRKGASKEGGGKPLIFMSEKIPVELTREEGIDLEKNESPEKDRMLARREKADLDKDTSTLEEISKAQSVEELVETANYHHAINTLEEKMPEGEKIAQKIGGRDIEIERVPEKTVFKIDGKEVEKGDLLKIIPTKKEFSQLHNSFKDIEARRKRRLEQEKQMRKEAEAAYHKGRSAAFRGYEISGNAADPGNGTGSEQYDDEREREDAAAAAALER